MTDQQLDFFRALKSIKDIEVELSEAFLSNSHNSSLKKEYTLLKQKLTTDEEITAFRNVQNELVETVIYRIMEMIDGYGDLPYEVDLIIKDSESLKGNIQLHDQFINYVSSEEKEEWQYANQLTHALVTQR